MTTHGPSDHERPRVRRMTPSDNEYQRMTTNDHEQHRVRTNKANVGFTLFQAFSFSTATNSFSCCTGLRRTAFPAVRGCVQRWIHGFCCTAALRPTLDPRFCPSAPLNPTLHPRFCYSAALRPTLDSRFCFRVALNPTLVSRFCFSTALHPTLDSRCLLHRGGASNVGFTVLLQRGAASNVGFTGFAFVQRCVQRWIHGFCFTAALSPTLDPRL